MRWLARKRTDDDLASRFVPVSAVETVTDAETVSEPETDEGRREGKRGTRDDVRGKGGDLTAARKAARERYAAIAAALKAEAGVTKHYQHKMLGGLAWSEQGKILAPEGVTRRQLYVLAHECGHVVLHGTPETWNKPGHVKEHEAEVYAHRAFRRYGIEVPAKSAHWARAYVGQWIMKDKMAGVPICPMATDFALGRRTPDDPLPSVDGQPPQDFSKHLDRFTAKGVRLVEKMEQEAGTSEQRIGLVSTGRSATTRAALDWAEEKLNSELIALARKLDKKGVRGVFDALASITEQVDRVKLASGSAVPTLTRGLGQLREMQREHGRQRAQGWSEAFKENEGPSFFFVFALLFAAGLLMTGLHTGETASLLGAGFFAVIAILAFVPIALHYRSNR